MAEIYWTIPSSYVCLRSLCTRQSLIVIALGGPREDTPHCVFSGLFVFGPAAVLLLNGNSEWHSGDAAGLSEFLPAVLFIITVKSYLLSGWAASERSPIGPHFEQHLDMSINPKAQFFSQLIWKSCKCSPPFSFDSPEAHQVVYGLPLGQRAKVGLG